MAQIVLIEDDFEIRRLVADALAAQGHDVEGAGAALEGLQLAVKGDPDLVVMDLGLPDLDGSELLRMIRAVSQVPVIVITARGADEVVVKTLDAGADDYLVKPFALAELAARTRALLRREEAASPVLRVGSLSLDPARFIATRGGAPLALTAKEFSLLEFLMAHVDEVMPQETLLEHVWDEMADPFTNTVRVTVSNLRKKLGEPNPIETVPGRGYVLRS